jgi:hypothetical protein
MIYPAIPLPTKDPDALLNSVLAIKQTLDILTGSVGKTTDNAIASQSDIANLASQGDLSNLATNAALAAAVAGLAPLASPTFTGVPAGPTAAVNTNTTQLATTAFTLANGGALSAITGSASGNVSSSSGYPTFVMAGYKFTYTPSRTGKLLVIMQQGVYVNPSATGVWIQCYGTGTPPNAGASAAGTNFGLTGSVPAPGCQATAIAPVTLSVGTTYWFDLAYCSIGAVSVTVANGGVNVIEL